MLNGKENIITTTSNNITLEKERIRSILATVYDPEVPVLTILDLGILRDINYSEEEGWIIDITPTYSGCPAMDVIRMQVHLVMAEHGYKKFKVRQVLHPAWTTDWMSEEGKRKLEEYGIAPPQYQVKKKGISLFEEEDAVPCPLCKSVNTHRVSEFGSTACKSLYVCDNCHEPFDYFKCH